MRTLYLIDLGGMEYGIWKDDVRSVSDVPAVHRLPLSPECIAGISVLDGRSTALADLAVCIGLQPVPISEQGRVVFVAGKDTDSGFVVPGPLEEVDVPPDAVFPMPEYVKTAEVDTCVVHGSRPVPVINIARLYSHLHEADPNPSVPAFTVPPARRPGLPSPGTMRLFTAGGELFAVPASIIPKPSVLPGRITPIALTPRHIEGLVFHEGTVFPVVHLAERMGLPARGDGRSMMVAGLSGIRFGFLIDEDKGTMPAGEMTVMPLPPVAETEWTPAAVLYRGAVVPVIDIAAVVGAAAREDAVKKLPGRYSPASRFSELFEKTGVEVVEFSLLGVRHALPKTELEDVVSFKPYRRIPDALPIVIGVAEHNGEVLPVLDLALVFGRRSLETPEWSMVLVRNGDFRAFVITEHVYDERVLSRDVQRKVPIILPHNLVYGCYPEGVAVRLILNVEALAVHFDKSIVKELLPALTREMAEAPAELVPSLLPEGHERKEEEAVVSAGGDAALKATAEAAAAERARQAADAGISEEAEARARAEAEERARRDAEERARAEAEEKVRREAEERSRREAEEKARTEAEAETQARQEVEAKARADAEARERREAEARAKREAEERTRQEAEKRSRREAEERVKRETEERVQAEAEARAEQEELARREADAKARAEAEEQARRDAEEQERRRAEERARTEAEEQVRREALERARGEEEVRIRRESEERARREREAAVREAEDIKRRAKPEPEPVPAGLGATAYEDRNRETPSFPAPSHETLHQRSRAKQKYALAVLAALLIAILVYVGMIRSNLDQTTKEGTVVKTIEEQDHEMAKVTTPSVSPRKPVREWPLVLQVPADVTVATDLYIVTKGDTLWGICERFTGNPFNYPRVASDNRIANPDLIFPGQKIMLKKQPPVQ